MTPETALLSRGTGSRYWSSWREIRRALRAESPLPVLALLCECMLLKHLVNAEYHHSPPASKPTRPLMPMIVSPTHVKCGREHRVPQVSSIFLYGGHLVGKVFLLTASPVPSFEVDGSAGAPAVYVIWVGYALRGGLVGVKGFFSTTGLMCPMVSLLMEYLFG